MLKVQKQLLVVFSLILTVFLGMGSAHSYAEGIVTFGPHETKMEGEIKYSVIGQYRAHFNSFKGRIVLDKNLQQIRSVYLEIEAGSIKSNHPWYDRIARSRRLLYVVRYPKIIFRGDNIISDGRDYKVRGTLEMHGVKKVISFPFKTDSINDQRIKKRLLLIHGSWVINRKDFNIVWNRFLDHGGILVGDDFTVNWGIKVNMPSSGPPSR